MANVIRSAVDPLSRSANGEMSAVQNGTRDPLEASALLLPNPRARLLDRTAFTAEEVEADPGL